MKAISNNILLHSIKMKFFRSDTIEIYIYLNCITQNVENLVTCVKKKILTCACCTLATVVEVCGDSPDDIVTCLEVNVEGEDLS